MHTLRSATRLSLLLSVFYLTGCVSMVAKKHTYDSSGSSPFVVVNGAEVRLQLKPIGTGGPLLNVKEIASGATSTTLDGPFLWKLEATGKPGVHEKLILHRLRTVTSITKRDEWFPEQYLGRSAKFRSPREPDKIAKLLEEKGVKSEFLGTGEADGKAKAVYDIPGKLEVLPEKDGALDVLAEVTVVANGLSDRRTVLFRLDPSRKRDSEFIFLPSEIINNIAKSPSNWRAKGWD